MLEYLAGASPTVQQEHGSAASLLGDVYVYAVVMEGHSVGFLISCEDSDLYYNFPDADGGNVGSGSKNRV